MVGCVRIFSPFLLTKSGVRSLFMNRRSEGDRSRRNSCYKRNTLLDTLSAIVVVSDRDVVGGIG